MDSSSRHSILGPLHRAWVLALLPLLFLPISAQGAWLDFGSAQVQGEQVALPIVFDPAGEPVASVQFQIVHAPGTLEFVGLQPGPVALQAGKDVVHASRNGRVTVIAAGLNQRTMGAGLLGTVVFRLVSGGTDRNVSLSNVVVSNPQGGSVQHVRPPSNDDDDEDDGGAPQPTPGSSPSGSIGNGTGTPEPSGSGNKAATPRLALGGYPNGLGATAQQQDESAAVASGMDVLAGASANASQVPEGANPATVGILAAGGISAANATASTAASPSPQPSAPVRQELRDRIAKLTSDPPASVPTTTSETSIEDLPADASNETKTQVAMASFPESSGAAPSNLTALPLGDIALPDTQEGPGRNWGLPVLLAVVLAIAAALFIPFRKKSARRGGRG